MENLPINPVDGLVFAAVLLSGILALIRGLVREVLSLISWSLAILAGFKLATYGKSWGLSITDNETVATAIGGFIIFFLVLLALTIISHYTAKIVRESALSAVDRSLGFAFGALRGFLVVVLVYLGGVMLFVQDEEDKPDWLKEAQTEPALRTAAGWLQGMMPKELRTDLEKSIGTGKEKAQDGAEKLDTLQRLTTPVPGTPVTGNAAPAAPAQPQQPAQPAKPVYDQMTRERLDALINQGTRTDDAPAEQAPGDQPQQVEPVIPAAPQQ